MLAGLSELKEYLGIQNASQDTFLTACLERASAIIEDYLQRKIEAADYSEKYDGKRANFIILEHYPVNSVTELKDGDDVISADDYVLYEKEGIIRLKSGYFNNGLQNVQVQYNAGYTNVPQAIEEACLEIATMIYKNADTGEGRLGKGSISIPEGGTLRYVSKLSPLLQEALRSYRRVVV